MLLDGWATYIHQPNKWVCVVLKQIGQDTWQVTAYAVTNVSSTASDFYTVVCYGSTLKTILSKWYNDASDVEFYVTDLRGIKSAEVTDKDTDKVTNLVLSVVYPAENHTAPDGYENIYLKKGLKKGDFSPKDISAYGLVRFMIKPSKTIYAGGYVITPREGWSVVTLVNARNGKWSVYVDGHAIGSFAGNSLCEILAGWQTASDDCLLYVTDLRGTLGVLKTSQIKAIAMSYADKSDEYIVKAAERLVAELKKICGVELLIEYHNDMSTFDVGKNYIVFGSLAKQIGLAEYGIRSDVGYKVEVLKGHLCMYSRTGHGMMYAAYGLLEEYFGLTYYTDEVYGYTNGNPDLGSSGAIIKNPDFDYTWAVDGAVTEGEDGNYNNDYMDRLGYTNAYEDLGGGWHNLTTLVSEEKYGANGTVANHPEWFVTKGTDAKFVTLDIANYCDAIAVAMANELAALINADSRNIWCVSAPDYYDVDLTSDVYVTFMNKVAANLEGKIDRKVELMLLAYMSTFAAPTVDLQPNDKVGFGVMVAPIESNYYYGFDNNTFVNSDGKTNVWYYQQIKAWGNKTDKLYAWNYSAYFDNYFVPLDTISNMQSRYRAYKEAGVSIIHDQGITQVKATDWNALKVYLKAALAKDVNADVDALIDKFMAAYYGQAAAPFMKQLLVAEQAHYATIADSMRGGHITRDSLFEKSLWKRDMLDTWYGYIESALNVTTDETLRNRIQTEALAIRYMRQVLHTTLVNKPEVVPVGGTAKVKDSLEQIKTDAKAVGITRFAESYGWVCGGSAKLVDGTIDNLA